MGFEIDLRCFEETESLGLRRNAIRALFPVEEAGSRPDYWSLRYDGEHNCEIGVNPLPTDATKLVGLYVDRPSRDVRLWDSLLRHSEYGWCPIVFSGERRSLLRSGAPLLVCPRKWWNLWVRPSRLTPAKRSGRSSTNH
jgi:hypothetical protein